MENTYYATGRRKTAVARTWLAPGSGNILINGRPVDDYFRVETAKAERTLPPLAGIEQSFKRSTEPNYVARLIDGLSRAGFE